MTKATATRIQQIRTVAIPVIDHDRALDFYVGKLGFEKRLNATFGEGHALGRGRTAAVADHQNP